MSKITTINPATEEEIQSYDIMTEKEATERLEVCHTAFLEWRKLTHQERAPYLKKIGQKLRDNADELAALMTKETGKLLSDGHLEIELCAAICDYTAQSGPETLADAFVWSRNAALSAINRWGLFILSSPGIFLSINRLVF